MVKLSQTLACDSSTTTKTGPSYFVSDSIGEEQLENDLDARLIDRMGKHNELAPLGEAVAAHARRLVF